MKVGGPLFIHQFEKGINLGHLLSPLAKVSEIKNLCTTIPGKYTKKSEIQQ